VTSKGANQGVLTAHSRYLVTDEDDEGVVREEAVALGGHLIVVFVSRSAAIWRREKREA